MPTYTLTTGIDNFTGTIYNDTFNASLSNGNQTLNTQDQLNGNGGIDTLNAEINTNVTPLSLQNIEVINLTNVDTATAHTVSLVNAGQAEEVTNDGSTGALTINGLAATADLLNVWDTDSATTFNYISTAGTQDVVLTVDNVGVANAGAGGAAVTLNGIEGIGIISGDGTTQANAVTLNANAAGEVVIEGDADLALTLGASTTSVELIDGELATGDLTITLVNQSGVLSTTAVSVLGGLGSDILDVSAETTSNVYVEGNDGDDLIIGGTVVNADSIDGGTGTNILSTTYAAAAALTSSNNINNIQVLDLSTALGGALTATTVDSTIVEVDVSVAGVGESLNSAASTITGGAGTFTVGLGATSATGVANDATLDNALTVTDTGTATTDTVAINNLAVDSTTGANLNVFNGQNITSTGYENVDLNTGVASPTAQTIGTLTITADSASAATDLDITGQSALSITSLTTNSTGLTSVDASGLNVATTVAGLTITGTTLGALGTQSIVGSAGIDTISVGAYASTIDGGTGSDVLTGNTLADSIHGGAGNDNITGAGGNDTLRGGEGNDTISAIVAGTVSIEGGTGNDTVTLAATLSASDVVDGGEGTDTLSVTAAITGTTGVGVTNFEILSTSVDQVISNTVNNTGWTTVLATATGVDITNASSTLNTFQVNEGADGGAASFDRLTDTGTNSLTFATAGTGGSAFDGTITTLTANDEESITLNVSNGLSTAAGALTINTLAAADLQTLTLVGDHNVTVTTITGATGLDTIDASALTGTAYVDASISTAAIEALGSATFANTLIGGSGADDITGGSANDSLVGNNGADDIVGGGGDDTMQGGQGADDISAGTGVDSVTAGTGADSVTLSVDGQTDTVVQSASDSVASTSTSYVVGSGVNFAEGQTITFGNGVDTVNNFLAGASGGDVLTIGTNTSNALLGTAENSGTIGWLSGTFSGGVFTVAANGIGPDTLVLLGTTINAATSRAVVLVGVDSDSLLNSNFGGSDLTDLTATYAGTTWTVAGQAIQTITVDATSATPNITAEVGATVGYAGTYAPGAVTVITFNGVTGGFGANVNLSGAINAALAQLTGTTGNDTFTYVNEDLGNVAAGVTVTGNGGTDTLALTNVEASVTLGTGGAGQTALVDIENLSLTNGTRNLADNATRTLTLANAVGAIDVTNASATAAATVVLNTNAGSSYTATGSGVNTLTVNQIDQDVATGTGSDVVNLNVAGAYTNVVNMGTGAADVLNTIAAGAYDLTGATMTGIDTLATAAATANTLTLSQTNFGAISTAITFGTTADILVLQDGTYDFSAKTLTFGSAASTLDLDTGSTGSKTITLDAADINNVGTITGEATGGAVTTLNFNGTTTLALVTFTDIDAMTVATANNTLTIAGDVYTASPVGTITGNAGDNNLTFAVGGGVANLSIAGSVVSGIDTISTTAAVSAADTFSLASTSVVGNATLVGDAGASLALTTGGDYTNITLTGGDFDALVLTTATTATLDTGMFAGAIVAVDSSAAADANMIVNMDAVTLNLGAVSIGATNDVDSTINGTAGNDTITLADAKAAGSAMEVNGNGGTDSFRFNEGSGNEVAAQGAQNLTLADAVSVNDFNSASDTFVGNSADLSGVNLTVGEVATGSWNLNTTGPGFALITGATVADFTSLVNVAAAVGLVTATANDIAYFAVTNVTGSQIGIYEVDFDATGAIDAADGLTLIAVLDNTGSFSAANLGLF